ncbi:Acetyltransferase (GNAT) family protein [compost metagenome]
MLICLRDYWNLEAVKELLALCMLADSGTLEQEMQRYFTEDSRELLGCFINGELGGMIGVKRQSDRAVEITHLAVKPKWQGKGIGRGMIMEISKSDGIETITAETDHETALFYRNAGFAVTSLGEKYPGVERFACVLSVGAAVQSRM